MCNSQGSPISIAILSILLALSIACSRHPSDDQIAKDIQDKAAADPETKESPVKVEAKEGKVILSGKVRTPAAQKKLKQIAGEEPGSTEVDDQTTVDCNRRLRNIISRRNNVALFLADAIQPVVRTDENVFARERRCRAGSRPRGTDGRGNRRRRGASSLGVHPAPALRSGRAGRGQWSRSESSQSNYANGLGLPGLTSKMRAMIRR